VNIKFDALVKAGAPFAFTVASPRRLTRVAVFIGRTLIHEVRHVEAPYGHTITLGDATVGQQLRITAVDAIGNNSDEWRIIDGVIADDAPEMATRLLKASDAVIAWTGPKANAGRAPRGSVGIGPFSEHGLWVSDYASSGGAVYARRRKLTGAWQRFEVMLDWYRISFVFGVDPAIVHRAFLEIQEYQALIDERDCDADEFSARPKSPMDVFRGAAGSLHIWPNGQQLPSAD
jgi:hypothetical protein